MEKRLIGSALNSATATCDAPYEGDQSATDDPHTDEINRVLAGAAAFRLTYRRRIPFSDFYEAAPREICIRKEDLQPWISRIRQADISILNIEVVSHADLRKGDGTENGLPLHPLSL